MQKIPKEVYDKIREGMYIQASFTLEAYLRQYRHMVKNSGKYSAQNIEHARIICMEQQNTYNRLDEIIDIIVNDQVNFNLARMGLEGITAKINNT